MKAHLTALTLAAALGTGTAFASPYTLNFEGIAPYPDSGNVLIKDYYNGGTASNGNSGFNFGVSFSSDASLLCLNSQDVICSSSSRGGLAPYSAQGALAFYNNLANENYLNVEAGFTTGFSFMYASQRSGSVEIYSGLNGTGSVLAYLTLSGVSDECPTYSARYCPYEAAGATFEGIAHSVSFVNATTKVGFDDLTFGSATPNDLGPPVVGDPSTEDPDPTTVPEPATLALFGFGLLGVRLARRKNAPTKTSAHCV